MIGVRVCFPRVYVVLAAQAGDKVSIAGAFYKRVKADELANNLRPSTLTSKLRSYRRLNEEQRGHSDLKPKTLVPHNLKQQKGASIMRSKKFRWTDERLQRLFERYWNGRSSAIRLRNRFRVTTEHTVCAIRKSGRSR
jgi:hypothetical protein